MKNNEMEEMENTFPNIQTCNFPIFLESGSPFMIMKPIISK